MWTKYNLGLETPVGNFILLQARPSGIDSSSTHHSEHKTKYVAKKKVNYIIFQIVGSQN